MTSRRSDKSARHMIRKGKEMVWDQILSLHEEDAASGPLRAMPKLSPSHLDPQAGEKMRVSYAVQVCTHTQQPTLRMKLQPSSGFTPAEKRTTK